MPTGDAARWLRLESEGRGNLFGLREVFWIVMHRPDIHHDNRIFRNKVSFIPIIFSDIMVVSKFVRWTPAQCFLPLVIALRRRTLTIARM